jgi:hypothetical protein
VPLATKSVINTFYPRLLKLYFQSTDDSWRRYSPGVRRAVALLLELQQKADVGCRERDSVWEGTDPGHEEWRSLPWTALRVCGVAATPAGPVRPRFCLQLPWIYYSTRKLVFYLNLWSVCCGMWIRDILVRIRILLFSSVTCKVQTKSNFFQFFFSYYRYFLKVPYIYISLQR